MQIDQLMNIMLNSAAQSRSEYHLCLGELIEALEKAPENNKVKITFVHNTDTKHNPGEPHSYRGYYSDLAFEFSNDEVKVKDFLDVARNALGKTFEGYKGGDFVMKESTPLWLSNYGVDSGYAIMYHKNKNEYFFLYCKEV